MSDITQAELNVLAENHLLWINDKLNNKDKRLILSGAFDGLVLVDKMIAGAILKNCTFTNCTFDYCFMQGVTFENSTLVGCSLKGSTLNESNFINATVQNCNVESINLNDAKLEMSSWPDTYFHKVIGDDVYIKNYMATGYTITYTHSYIYADCQRKTIDEWDNVTDEELMLVDGDKAVKEYYRLRFLVNTKINSSPAKPFDR